MSSQSPRLNEIDLLRGIACICVVAFHYFSRGPSVHIVHGVDCSIVEAVARYGYMGVHLFFVISGFVIFMSMEKATARSFFASRVARLYPAFWVGVTLTAGTAWIAQDYRFEVSVRDYLINLTMFAHWFNTPYVDGVYWSLAYELHFYILVWLVLRLGLIAHSQSLLAGWLLISGINAFYPIWPMEFWLDAKWAPLFIAGCVFYLIRVSGITCSRIALLGIAFMLALFYTWLDEKQKHPTESAMIPALILTWIFIVFWLITTRRMKIKNSPLTFWLGTLTYPVYIIHQNFGFIILTQLHKIFDNPPMEMSITLIAVMLLGFIIYAFIERPLGKKIKAPLENCRLGSLYVHMLKR